MAAFLSFLVTLFALSFLIFLHELGHLLAARYVGAKVISFNIGLGRSLFTFRAWDLEWRFNLFPIGGAVEIAGMQPGSYDEAGGFYQVSPLRRILIVIAGPLANLIIALVCFTFLYSTGGRVRSFLEQTQHIGYVHSKGAFYSAGLRSGDRILSYDGRVVTGFQDHLLTPILKTTPIDVQAQKYFWNTVPLRSDASTQNLDIPKYKGTHFTQKITPRINDERGLYSFGIMDPSSFLLVTEDAIASNDSEWGVQVNDQLLWVNGYRVFSRMQLSKIFNNNTVYTLLERDGKILGFPVQFVTSDELEYNKVHRDQITDWILDQPGTRSYSNVKTLPYLLTADAVVEQTLEFSERQSNGLESPQLFLKGDKILAINGINIFSRADVFDCLQNRSVLLICYRPEGKPVEVSTTDSIISSASSKDLLTPREADALLRSRIASPEIDALAVARSPSRQGDFVRLATRPLQKNKILFPDAHEDRKKHFDGLPRDSEKAIQLQALSSWANTYAIGLFFKDALVKDIQTPLVLLQTLLNENMRTFSALATGRLSPKWLSGPVGMFSTVYKSQKVGFNEQIYWLGFLSVGLAFFNLLPIPVLDGGHLIFNLLSILLRRPLNPVWMERLTLPFALLLISLITYATYWDIARLFG